MIFRVSYIFAERERLIRYKFRWAEADEAPQDNMLSVEEMKNFRHPEQSSKMIVRMAKDIIENLGIIWFACFLICFSCFFADLLLLIR